jgi:hypothetical protein
MGLVYRKRLRLGRNSSVNLSNSGVSLSQRIGRRVTINSRGRGSLRLFKGLSWRFKI